MKFSLLAITSILALSISTASSRASVLAGVNFTGSSGVALTETDSAGYAPQKFWNNANNASGQLNSLQADAGGTIGAFYSGFSAQWQSAEVGSSSGTALLPNSKLMKGCLLGTAGAPAFVQLSAIPLFGSTCSIIVYADVPGNTQDVNIKVTIQTGSTTKSLKLRDVANQPFNGSFSRAAFTDGTVVAANTVIFGGIQATDIAVVVEPDESNPNATVSINAIQVVPNIASFAPRIVSATKATTIVNLDFAYAMLTDVPPTSRQVTGLPSGLIFDPSAGVISGRPVQPGTFNVTLTAANGTGSTSETLLLTVLGSNAWNATLFMLPALYIEGEAGRTFRIEHANTLGNPTVWQIATNITLTNSSQFYVDLAATNRAYRFYRATPVE